MTAGQGQREHGEHQELVEALRVVRRREALAAARRALLGTLGLLALAAVLGGLYRIVRAPLGWPVPDFGGLTGLALPTGLFVLGTLIFLATLGRDFTSHRPWGRVGLLHAARLAERRLGHDELLTTTLSLPAADPPTGRGSVEQVLRARLRRQTLALVPRVRQEYRAPGLSRRAVLTPAGAVLLALSLWLLPALPAAPLNAAAGRASPAREVARTESEPPTLSPAPELPGEGAPGGTASSAPPGAPGDLIAATPGGVRSAPRQDNRPALSQQGAPDSAGNRTDEETSTRSTPFGARESAPFVNQSVQDRQDPLASAPYDPSSGSTAPAGEKPEGSSGLRQASGGRGLESEGTDRCVQGCLTNNDMNRAASPGAPRREAKKEGPDAPSGTSDSGGMAAGSSSQVGLGAGSRAIPQLQVRRRVLPPAAVNAQSVQVLSLPEAARPTSRESARAPAGAWVARPERPVFSEGLAEQYRQAAQEYFRRNE